jgi:hypothetical protein
MQIPTITINTNSNIEVTRLLPVPGDTLVQRGQKVAALDVIARTELASHYQVIDVARQLALSKLDMDVVMLKREGESVAANEAIASARGRLPLLRRTVRAPLAGHIAAIGAGWVLLEIERTTVELQAFVNGVVSTVVTNRGARIEAHGARIVASCGFGGEAYGLLKRLVDSPRESLQEAAIDENVKNTILLGGRSVDEAILRTAEAAQVRGIIVGSIDASLLTLDPPVKVRVVATEGFGDIPMSPYAFGILVRLDGREISIRGNTTQSLSADQGRKLVESPVVLWTTSKNVTSHVSASPTGKRRISEIRVGSRVRVSYGQLLGASGTIASIPTKPQATDAGIVAPGAYVMIDNTSRYIPWANLEEVI